MPGSILIAEDDRVLCEIVRFNLSRAGFDVVFAHDGAEASKLASLRHFDLIVTDYQMPRLTGEEFCRTVRAGERNRETPIFFCTAKGFEIDYERLLNELRITRFILKPFSPRELVAAVTEVLGEMASVD